MLLSSATPVLSETILGPSLNRAGEVLLEKGSSAVSLGDKSQFLRNLFHHPWDYYFVGNSLYNRRTANKGFPIPNNPFLRKIVPIHSSEV